MTDNAPVTEAQIGAPPLEYDIGWTSRFVNAVNIVLRSISEFITWITTDPNPLDQYLLEQVAVDTFVYAAYGGGKSNATATTVLGAGWDVLHIDTISPQPNHMVVNLVNNSIAWPVAGVNALSLSVSLEHDESNGSRVFYLRAYNVTKGVGLSDGIPVGIARNQGATTFSAVIPLEIQPGYENDELVIQAGNTGDSITVISWPVISIWSFNVGQFLGDIAGVSRAESKKLFSNGFNEGFK